MPLRAPFPVAPADPETGPARAGARVYGAPVAGDAEVSASAVGGEPDRDGRAARDPRDVEVEAAWVEERPDALRMAYDQFGAVVHTYCVRGLGGRDAAADCVQETFVAAWRSRDRFDPARGTLAGWLLGIARYRVLDVHRAAGRVPTPTGEPVAEPGSGAGGAAPTGSAAVSEADALVDRLLLARALESLSSRARSVVELAFWSDLSQSEIAAELDLPLGTVKSDMRRALIRLRAVVEDGRGDRG